MRTATLLLIAVVAAGILCLGSLGIVLRAAIKQQPVPGTIVGSMLLAGLGFVVGAAVTIIADVTIN